MKVTVIKKQESVIYNGKIYRYNDSFEADEAIGKSLMERGYVAITAAAPADEMPVEEAEDSDSEELPNTAMPE